MESGHAGSHGAWETPVPAGGPNIGRKSMKPLYKEKYPHVFTPLTVGKKGQVTFKHRIMVPPIGSQGDIVDSHHRLNRDGVEFYMHWARGGAACITVPMEIPANGGHRGDLVLDDEVDGFIYMHNLQRPAHMYGTKTLCEIYHAGCCMLPWLSSAIRSEISPVLMTDICTLKACPIPSISSSSRACCTISRRKSSVFPL